MLENKLFNLGVPGIVALVSIGNWFVPKANAQVLDYLNPQSIQVVSSSEDMGKATISESWIAWEAGGNIYAKNRETGIETLVIDSGTAKNPNLDSVGGIILVYDDAGNIYKRDLEQMITEPIYVGPEICSNPKVNEDNVIFLADDEIWTHSFPEEMGYPITNSGNPKQSLDIFGNYAIWCELEDSYYEGIKKHNIHLYTFSTGNESTIGANFITGDLSSAAIYNNKIGAVANSIDWANGPTSLFVLDLDTSSTHIYHSSSGKKEDVAMHGDLMTWTQYGKIHGFDITSPHDLSQFYVGAGYNSDVFVDEQGTVNVVYMSESGPVENGSMMAAASSELDYHLLKGSVIHYPGPTNCGDRDTKFVKSDLDKDCRVNNSDFSLFAAQFGNEGLTNGYPIDGDYTNWEPNNMIEYCEVPPQFRIGNEFRTADFNGDCKVDLEDFSEFASSWLGCSKNYSGECLD